MESNKPKTEFRMVNKQVVVHIPLTDSEIRNQKMSEDDYWEQLANQKLEDVDVEEDET